MIILSTILGATAYRIRGGGGNEIVRKILKKPEGWEILNGWIRCIWALFVTLNFPLNLASPVMFIISFFGVTMGYWGGEFDLTKQENRTWKNYAILAARGAFIILPLALCFTLSYPQLWFSVLAGALMPAFYLLGVGIGKKYAILGTSQWGELLIGAAIGFALCL